MTALPAVDVQADEPDPPDDDLTDWIAELRDGLQVTQSCSWTGVVESPRPVGYMGVGLSAKSGSSPVPSPRLTPGTLAAADCGCTGSVHATTGGAYPSTSLVVTSPCDGGHPSHPELLARGVIGHFASERVRAIGGIELEVDR